MKLVYAITNYTNTTRELARHLDNGKGHPLCGRIGSKVSGWKPEQGQPTCKLCIRYEQVIGELQSLREKIDDARGVWDKDLLDPINLLCTRLERCVTARNRRLKMGEYGILIQFAKLLNNIKHDQLL